MGCHMPDREKEEKEEEEEKHYSLFAFPVSETSPHSGNIQGIFREHSLRNQTTFSANKKSCLRRVLGKYINKIMFHGRLSENKSLQKRKKILLSV